jgi:poly(3-hydroxybutyrate) depolymerase
MLYTAYEWQRRLTAPARVSSQLLDRTLETLPAPVAGLPVSRRIRAACQIVAASRPTRIRPDWVIDSVVVGGEEAGVTVRPVLSTPFATLMHFDEPSVGDQPRTLVVGPISGHFATLARGCGTG